MSLKVLEFETQNSKYIYDGVTGTVMAVDDILLDCIYGYESKGEEELQQELRKKYQDERRIDAAMAFVKKYSTKAFYMDDEAEKEKWEDSVNVTGETIRNLMKVGFTQQIILNVTEDCNMRCKYCFLSETYHYTRNRTNKMMSVETAKKALDLYFSMMKQYGEINPGKKCAVTFYGGEPLLNFEVIKWAIEYTKKNSPIGYMFNITTNGTLLKGEIADYLVQHNTAITVSLDGCEEEHDRNRLSAGKRGTYKTVTDNIREFVKKYPSYKKINLSCVYDYCTDLITNDEFFMENSDWLPYVGSVSLVSTNGTDYYEQFSEEDIRKFTERFIRFRQEYAMAVIQNEKRSSYKDIFFTLQLMPAVLKYGIEDKKLPIVPYTGACFPGMKFSVRTDGKFDVCEKIEGTRSIGDVDSGFDVEAIAQLVKDYNRNVTAQCGRCPISKQCPMCYAYAIRNGSFNSPKCDELVQVFKASLMTQYTILEYNPHATDNFIYREEWILNS